MRAALLLAALLLAGCAQPATEPAVSAASAPQVEIVDDRPQTSFGEVATGPAAGPDLDATTREAPRLVAGEWWRIRFASSLFPDTPEFVRVVAHAGPEGYLLGMPHEGWHKEAIAYHAPSFGDVGLDLSYDLHNVRFEPLRFPLETGATWTTAFGPSEFTATVESADEWTAIIHLKPVEGEAGPTDVVFDAIDPLAGFDGMRVTYDARQHEIVKFESFIGTWEVVEHGYGYEGWVTVPRGVHTAIDHGQFLPATPGEPLILRTQTIEGGYNRLTLMHGIFALGPGAYRVRALAPDGSEFLTQVVGGEGLTVAFYEAVDPDGEWQLEDVVGGPGGTFSMGMAYHQYDVRLPDGARRSDHSHDVVR